MSAEVDPLAFPFGNADGLDLHPEYARCQKSGLVRVRPPYGEDAWLATTYEDVKTVLRDRRFSRAAADEHQEARLTPLPLRTSILGMDPPDHTRLRRLLAAGFTERRVTHLRPRVRELTDDLLTEITRHGAPADFVELFAVPLAGSVICALLGVPYEDSTRFQNWTEAFASTTALPVDEVETKTAALYTYMADLIRRRRRSPCEDLVSDLLRTADQQDGLAEQELIELLSVLLVAGHDTTAAHLASSIYVLVTHVEQTRLLRREPELLPRAVEELLRFVPLIADVSFARYATADVELGGTLVRAGEAVLPAIPAANRDGTVFSDPDEVDFRREDNPHCGLGYGLHHCLGAALVRMELHTVLSVLLDRFPELRLAMPEDQVRWRPGLQVRSLESLPLAW